MNRPFLLAVLSLTLLLALLAFDVIPLKWLTLPSFPSRTTQTKTEKLTQAELIEKYPPIKLDHPAISTVTIFYNLQGTIESVAKEQSGDFLLRLTAKNGEAVPLPLRVSADKVSVQVKNTSNSIKVADLKKGDNVEIVYGVDLKTLKARVTQISLER